MLSGKEREAAWAYIFPSMFGGGSVGAICLGCKTSFQTSLAYNTCFLWSQGFPCLTSSTERLKFGLVGLSASYRVLCPCWSVSVLGQCCSGPGTLVIYRRLLLYNATLCTFSFSADCKMPWQFPRWLIRSSLLPDYGYSCLHLLNCTIVSLLRPGIFHSMFWRGNGLGCCFLCSNMAVWFLLLGLFLLQQAMCWFGTSFSLQRHSRQERVCAKSCTVYWPVHDSSLAVRTGYDTMESCEGAKMQLL